jgi:hypothetical protein
VCEGAFDALALLAAGVPRVIAIYGVHGWRWDWVREVRELVFALDADVAGQQQWQALVRQAALRGKQVAAVPAAAYGGCKDGSEAWAAGVLAVADDLSEVWAERVAIMVEDGGVPRPDAARLAWGACLPSAAPSYGCGAES